MDVQKDTDVIAMEKGEAGYAEGQAPTRVTQCALSSSPTSTTQSSSFSKPPPPLRQQKRGFRSCVACRALPKWPKTFLTKVPIPKGKLQPRKKYRIPVKTRRLNDHPKGYPNLTAFLDSDEGFGIYRRFGYLQSRLLLYKQEELRALEERLQSTEMKIATDDEEALCYSDLFGPYAAEHRQLLSNIETTFCSYARLLTASQQMMTFNRPSDSEYQSVGRYMNNRKPLGEEEATWIHHKEDIITLRPGREHAWLDDVVEGFLKACHCPLVDMIFRSKETRKKTEIDSSNMPGRPPKDEDKYELYYTPSRIAKLAISILVLFILVLLVLPIYLLYHMAHDIGTHKAYLTCIATLLVFTLAFSSILSLFTQARRHEILAAAAAYCAVLVVFLGNVATPNYP